jgi:NTP pyrophosphatase (non-canonical NTP hydrolase)
MKKELGDVLWFVSEMSYMIGTNLSEVAELNVKKLQDRQKRNTLKGSGDNR